jgi:hypothetical protein
MTRLLWVHGRFSWPLVVVVAYLSASFVILDYVWRVVVMPFDTLLLYAVIIWGVFFVLIVALMLRYRKVRAKQAIAGEHPS